MATYLSMVNEVLMRLREEPVYAVDQSAYSKMIGLYINDAKRQVEEAWDWDALNTTLPLTVVPGTTTYVVLGSGTRQKSIDVNVTSVGHQAKLRAVSSKWIQDQQQLSTVSPAAPGYYAWNGSNGIDSKVEIFPTPNGTYNLAFNMNVPQVDLVNGSDVLLVPSEPVVAGAFARALVERGEDGALSSSEAYGLYKGVLADRIAIEQSRSEDYSTWEVV